MGRITIDGANAAVGTVVTALNGAAVCGVSSDAGVYNGTEYYLDLDPSVAGCVDPAASLTFTINGQPADQTVSPPSDGSVLLEVDLTATTRYACGPCSADALQAIALTQTDLPNGWTIGASTDPVLAKTPNALATLSQSASNAGAITAAIQSGANPTSITPTTINVDYVTYGTKVDAAAALGGGTLFRAEHVTGLTSSGGTVTYTSLPAVAVGEDERTYSLAITDSGLNFNAYVVEFYRKGVLVDIYVSGPQQQDALTLATALAKMIDGRLSALTR